MPSYTLDASKLTNRYRVPDATKVADLADYAKDVGTKVSLGHDINAD